MNILRIAIKELKVIRDIKMLVFMLITPVALMLILGTALTNAFNESVEVKEIRVLYSNKIADRVLAAYWQGFVREAGNSGIYFESANQRTDGKQEVMNNRYTGYVEISDHGITYYGSTQNAIESDIAQSMLKAFTDRYKLAVEAAKIDVGLSGGESGDYVQEASLNAPRQPGALDYYSVVVTTMIILYSALSAGVLMEKERKGKTSVRLLASPVTKTEIFAGKIIGTLVLNSIFVVIVVLISKYMFRAYWGEHLFFVFLVLFTEIVFAVSLGLGISYVVKGEASGAIIMLIIQLAAFFGGSYFPIDDTPGFMNMISHYSPLQWSNDAILQIIYANDWPAAYNAVLLHIGFALLLLIVAGVLMRRREGL